MPVLTAILLLPFLGALVILLVPSARVLAIKVVAAVAASGTLGLSLYVFLSYDHVRGGYQFIETYRWLPGAGISFHLGVDGISVPMVLLTGVIIFAGVFIAWNTALRAKDFFVLLLLLVTGVMGVFISLDLFFLFFFYELAVLPMYLLIGVWGSSSDFGTFIRTKEYGAMKLTIYLVAGSVLVWVGILAVYVAAGLGTFDMVALGRDALTPDLQRLVFPLFLVGFGVLAGLWPFHTWSPDGHVAAPTAVSMLHAGVLMKLGAFGIIRVGIGLLPQGAEAWMPLLMVLGTINVVYGAISALSQRDLKYVVGYSSVSHMGYVLMGFATLNPVGMSGAVLQMFSHGIMTALFFALVGFIYDRAHTRDITMFGGLAKRMGTTAAFFTVAGLTSMGLPGLSGFVAEFLVFVGTFQTYPLFGALGIAGAAITAIYILRLLARVFFGPLDPRWEGLSDPTRIETFASAVLVLVLIFVGLYPAPLMAAINSGIGPLLAGIPGAG
ncbi:MAG: NADH-quinone oxidoreductase subunit M [Dehalococcoidia bacterium]